MALQHPDCQMSLHADAMFTAHLWQNFNLIAKLLCKLENHVPLRLRLRPLTRFAPFRHTGRRIFRYI